MLCSATSKTEKESKIVCSVKKSTKRVKRMQELQNLAVSVGTVIVFTCIYSIILLIACPNSSDFNGLHDEKDSEKLFNRFYFTITTLSTTGFGDVTPKSSRAKYATIVLQILTTVGTLTTLISFIKGRYTSLNRTTT